MVEPAAGGTGGGTGTIEPGAGGPDLTKGTTEDWRSGFTDETKQHPNYKSLEKFKGVDDLAKSYLHAERQNSKSVLLPDENATDEVMKDFRVKMGVPEKSDAYPNLDATSFPKDTKPIPEFDEKMKAVAHELGYTPKQFSGMQKFAYNYMFDVNNASKNLEENEFVQAENKLKQDWGQEYDSRSSMAIRTFMEFFPKDKYSDLYAFMDKSGLGNNPHLLRMFSELGKQVMEDSAIDGARGKREFETTPEEAKSKLSDIRGNKSNPLYERFRAGDKEAVGEVRALTRIATDGQ